MEEALAELVSAQEERKQAEECLKAAKMREVAAKKALAAAKAASVNSCLPRSGGPISGVEENQPSTAVKVAMPVPDNARKRRGCAEELLALPDLNKNSLEAKRNAKKAKQCFEEGDRVQAKYLASSRGGQSAGWFKGHILARNDRGETYTYHVRYDDGDEEEDVHAQFVRSLPSAAAPPRANAAAGMAPPSSAAKAPSPAAKAPSPAAKAPSLAAKAPSPAAKAPSPAAKASSPAAKAPSPAAEAPAPAPLPSPKALITQRARIPEAAPIAEPASVAEAAATSLGDFLYHQPWHKTADSCSAHGCKLTHIMLQDFLPNAQSGDRNKLRKAVRENKMIGTTGVPKPRENGTGSRRDKWWWHEGDPSLEFARKLLGK